MAPKILLIDDEESICNLVRLHFQTEGYLVYTALDAEEAIQALSRKPDLILLDINMPETDGLEFCRRIRNNIDCPILFLTSRVTEQDKITGLQAGGDDYITKPFSLAELTARVEAHLRRESRARHGSMKISGELFIDYAGRCVYCKEQAIPFSKKEFDIVEFMSLHAGQVFDKERIYESIWGYDSEGSSDISHIADNDLGQLFGGNAGAAFRHRKTEPERNLLTGGAAVADRGAVRCRSIPDNGKYR